MPDPLRKTLSATETPGLFGVSPYVTKWMLWQKFAKGVDIEGVADSRMTWGLKLQPLIIAQAADDLRLEVRPNTDDTYHRAGLLGCTRDATIICPDRGPGALETKCVFDYRTWMADWDGGRKAPKHYEIQLQQQMMVGDGGPYKWGIIAAWVAGDVHYFERQPIPELWNKIGDAAREFFEDVAEQREPDPFGTAPETEWLTKLLPIAAGKVIDLSGEPDAEKHVETARFYRDAKEQESAGKRESERLRPQILALARDAEAVLLPGGVSLRISKAGASGKRIKVFDPIELTGGSRVPLSDILNGG